MDCNAHVEQPLCRKVYCWNKVNSEKLQKLVESKVAEFMSFSTGNTPVETLWKKMKTIIGQLGHLRSIKDDQQTLLPTMVYQKMSTCNKHEKTCFHQSAQNQIRLAVLKTPRLGFHMWLQTNLPQFSITIIFQTSMKWCKILENWHHVASPYKSGKFNWGKAVTHHIVSHTCICFKVMEHIWSAEIVYLTWTITRSWMTSSFDSWRRGHVRHSSLQQSIT